MTIIYHRFAVRITTQVTIIINFRHQNWKIAVGLINFKISIERTLNYHYTYMGWTKAAGMLNLLFIFLKRNYSSFLTKDPLFFTPAGLFWPIGEFKG